jgi:hypothetical protein
MYKMKKTIGVVLMATSLTTNAQSLSDWSTLDKTLLVASTATNVVDWGQTRTIAMNPDQWRERNPLLGDHPSVGRVNTYFISRLILIPVLAHYLPEYRTAILSLWLAIGVGYSGHNHIIGLRMTW